MLIRVLRSVAIAMGIGFFCLPAARMQSQNTANRTVPNDLIGRQATSAHLQRQEGQGTRSSVTVTLKDATLDDALRAIAKAADVGIIYRKAQLPSHLRVSISAVDLPLKDALASVLKGTNLAAEIKSPGQVLITEKRANDKNSSQESGTIQGTILDSATGKGIAGVTVKVQGRQSGATTSESGQFELRGLPVGSYTLIAKAFGYRSVNHSATISRGERTMVRIILASIPTVLRGVITSASGQQQRQQVGNDITVLNADSILKVAPVRTLTDLLETRVPGLTVVPSSGVPGSPARIRLRGTSSIERDNDPIVIIDGVRVNASQPKTAKENLSGGLLPEDVGFAAAPSPLDQIDPNTIDTVQVFKGASAAALYGADAGNGVIIITTKQGREGAMYRGMTAEIGQSSLPGDYAINFFPFGKDYYGADMSCWNRVNGDLRTRCITFDSVLVFQALNDPRFTVLGTGHRHQVSTTVSGGLTNLNYSFTGSLSDDIGLLRLPAIEVDRFFETHGFSAPKWMRRPTRYTTWGGQSQVGIKVGKRGQGMVTLSNALFRSEQQQSSLQTALEYMQSTYIDTTQLDTRALLPEYYRRRQNRALTFRTSAQLNGMNLTSWLPIMGTVGLDLGNRETRSLLPRNFNIGVSDSVGSFSISQNRELLTTITIGTQFHRAGWGRLPGIAIPIGFNFQGRTSTGVTGRKDTLPIGSNFPDFLSRGSAQELTTATYGWYLAPTLNLNSRLFLNPGIRIDGGSASGATAGFAPFPKMDLSWIAIDPDNPAFGIISMLRPRVSFGIAGVQPSPGDHLRLFQKTMVAPLGSTANRDIAMMSTIGNTNLRPERSQQIEGGFDLELWNQRATLIFSTYHKLRYDAILTTGVAPSIGAGTLEFKQNVGTVRNTGFDASLTTQLLQSRVFDWQVVTNVSKNSNVLRHLAAGIDSRIVGRTGGFENGLGMENRLVAGYPLFGLWARPLEGFADANGNGRIEVEEIRVGDEPVYVGVPEPQYQLSLSTTIKLFNGRLSMNTAVDYQSRFTQYFGIDSYSNRYFDPSLTSAEQASMLTAIGRAQTVSMLRWQSLSLNYQVPLSATKALRLSSLNVQLQGSNLGLHTNYQGKDPSVNAYGAGGFQTADTGELPRPRSWQLRMTMGL